MDRKGKLEIIIDEDDQELTSSDVAHGNGQFKATRFLLELARKIEMGVRPKKHRQGFKSFENCFKCQVAVKWLWDYMQSLRPDGFLTQRHAADLLQTFQDFGIIEDVRGPDYNKSITVDRRLLRFNFLAMEQRNSSLEGSAEKSDAQEKAFKNTDADASDLLCIGLVSSYLCRHIGGSSVEAVHKVLMNSPALKLDNVYANIVNQANQSNKQVLAIPDWLVELTGALAGWPESFEKGYRIFLPNMLTLISDFLNKNMIYFEGMKDIMDALLQFTDMIVDLASESDDKDISEKTSKRPILANMINESKPRDNVPTTRNHSQMSIKTYMIVDLASESDDKDASEKTSKRPILANKINESEHMDNVPITRHHSQMSIKSCDPTLLLHLQHLVLLLNPTRRTNLMELLGLLQPVVSNPILAADARCIHWVDDMSKLLIGENYMTHKVVANTLMIQPHNVFKIPRLLLSVCDGCQPDVKVKGVKRKGSLLTRSLRGKLPRWNLRSMSMSTAGK